MDVWITANMYNVSKCDSTLIKTNRVYGLCVTLNNIYAYVAESKIEGTDRTLAIF